MSIDLIEVHHSILAQFIERIQECHELLEEVRAGEQREHELHGVIYAYRTRLTLSELENRKLRYQRGKLTGEGKDLRAQLDEWERTRTLGGPGKPYSDANWANAKLSGVQPPPYTPAIETGRVES